MRQFICFIIVTPMIEVINLQFLTIPKISILFNCYDAIVLALLHYQKNEKNLLANQLTLTIILWLPIKKVLVDMCGL